MEGWRDHLNFFWTGFKVMAVFTLAMLLAVSVVGFAASVTGRIAERLTCEGQR